MAMTVYTMDRNCHQINFWLDGSTLTIGSIDNVDLNKSDSIKEGVTNVFSLLLELMENPKLAEFRIKASTEKNQYKFCKSSSNGDVLYIDYIDINGKKGRQFLFDRGNLIEIDIALALIFAKANQKLLKETLEEVNQATLIDFRYDTKIYSEVYDKTDPLVFTSSDLLESDIEEDDEDYSEE